MKITHVEAFAYAIPGNPYVGGHGADAAEAPRGRYMRHRHYRAVYSPNAEGMLVRIATDGGIEGFGEAQAPIVPDAVAAVVRELLAPVLIGADPQNPAVLRDRLYDLMRERGHDAGLIPDAIAACDMALWDIAARAAGLPLHRMLGGAYRETLPCYVSGVPAASLGEELDAIAGWIERGFGRFKFSYPPGIASHVSHLAAIRERFGDGIQIMIDAHWAYTVREALDLDRALEPFNVHWIECPCAPENAANQARVGLRMKAAHALGEEYRTRYHFQDRLARGAIDIAQPDVGRAGVTEALRIAALCEAHDVPLAYHLGAGLGVYMAATLHVAAATRSLGVVEFQPTQTAVADRFFSPSLQPCRGEYALPPGPGLGVTPDLEALRRHAL